MFDSCSPLRLNHREILNKIHVQVLINAISNQLGCDPMRTWLIKYMLTSVASVNFSGSHVLSCQVECQLLRSGSMSWDIWHRITGINVISTTPWLIQPKFARFPTYVGKTSELYLGRWIGTQKYHSTIGKRSWIWCVSLSGRRTYWSPATSLVGV